MYTTNAIMPKSKVTIHTHKLQQNVTPSQNAFRDNKLII